ncbi:vesicle-associated membrane protein 2-like [Arapaima gigas]
MPLPSCRAKENCVALSPLIPPPRSAAPALQYREPACRKTRERCISSPQYPRVSAPPPAPSQQVSLSFSSNDVSIFTFNAVSSPAPDVAAPGGIPGAPGAGEGEGGPPAPPPNLTSNRRLQQTQAQVEEVVDIMRVNVDKVLERDQKLSELDDRADALQAGASQFESSAAKLKNKYWWKNCKMMIMMAVIGVILVGILFCKYFLLFFYL